MMPRWILLPGLDGIGRFRTLRAELAARGIPHRALSYPPDLSLGLDELVVRVEGEVRAEEAWVAVAESFSSLIAIELAARGTRGLRAVVFAAGFCASPLSGPLALLTALPGTWLFRLRPPRWLLRHYFLGSTADADLVVDLLDSARSVRPEVLAQRVADIRRRNLCGRLEAVRLPLLYLRAGDDRLVGMKALAAMRRACPALEAVVLPAPHMLLQTHAHEAVEAVLAFLARHGLG